MGPSQSSAENITVYPTSQSSIYSNAAPKTHSSPTSNEHEVEETVKSTSGSYYSLEKPPPQSHTQHKPFAGVQGSSKEQSSFPQAAHASRFGSPLRSNASLGPLVDLKFNNEMSLPRKPDISVTEGKPFDMAHR